MVLTGGSSRVSDAMELLAGGYGKRLLISGVHPTNAASDISRSLPDNQSLLTCCVDLDRSAVNTRSNAAETRRWAHERGFKSLIVVTSNYHMPRAIVELSHAMPDIALIPYRGGRRQMARRAVVDQWRDVAAAAIGICQIRRRRNAGAAGRCRSRTRRRSPPTSRPDRSRAQTGDGPTASQLIGFSMVSIFLRSLVYNVLFYLLLVFWMLVGDSDLSDAARAHHADRQGLGAQQHLADARGLQHQGGISRARENSQGPLIVASKHQSMWETFALMQFFDAAAVHPQARTGLDPAVRLVPDEVEHDRRRSQPAAALADGDDAARAGEEVRRGRQLIIFPEGTRTPVDAPPNYKTGVGQIYADSDVACLPVALNSGLFWPRRTFMRYPGTLVVEFLDPLPPGLTRKEFIARISTVIEDATNRLVEAARAEQAQLFGRVPSSPPKGSGFMTPRSGDAVHALRAASRPADAAAIPKTLRLDRLTVAST